MRRSQVWIGGTRPGNAAFVPPPADAVPECLKQFERFLNDEPEPTPPLIKAALAHVQFETIHPFLDGNGRIGRLLIVLQLVADGVLREPMLYPSLFFKTHRSLYYELLNEVRLRGDWERWLDFFAEGVQVTRDAGRGHGQCAARAGDRRPRPHRRLGRAATVGAGGAPGACSGSPSPPRRSLVKATGLTAGYGEQVAGASGELGIVAELTRRQRGRVFSYRRYVDCSIELSCERSRRSRPR